MRGFSFGYLRCSAAVEERPFRAAFGRSKQAFRPGARVPQRLKPFGFAIERRPERPTLPRLRLRFADVRLASVQFANVRFENVRFDNALENNRITWNEMGDA